MQDHDIIYDITHDIKMYIKDIPSYQHNSRIQFNKLNHFIKSIDNKNTDRDINKGIIENIINKYDKLFEDIYYQFPNHIRQKVIKKIGGVKKLPNSLEIDYNNTIKKDYMNNMMCDVVSSNV